MSNFKRITVAATTGLIWLATTEPVTPAGPMRAGMALPLSALNFRVGTQPITPFAGFSNNPMLGLQSALAQQQALALQLANQRTLLGTNPRLSQELVAALRTNPFLARDLMRTDPALARQLMRTDRGLFRDLQQIDPTLARDLRAVLRTNPGLLDQLPITSPLTNQAGYPATMSSYPYPNPYSSSMTGAADITTAQSQMMLANQQSLMLHESVLRSKLEQRRRVFDEWLYERANTPSMEDLREREQDLVLRRSRNDPPLPEIYSAQALNSLLVELQKLEAKGTALAPVNLEENVLKNINVTAAQNGSNFGLLKHEGELSWPAILRELPPAGDTQALRKEIDTLVKAALSQAKNGKVDAGILAQLFGDVRSLRDLLKLNAGELSFARYSSARRYLDELEDALKVLQQADAANFILGKFAAKGKTVRDLVQHMTSLGLVFAPAVSGDEAAYLALQRALAEASQRAQVQTAAER